MPNAQSPVETSLSPRPSSLEHLWMGGVPRAPSSGEPLIIQRGEGIYLWDETGNRYIDAIASLETCAAGHARPEIRAAIVAQLEELDFFDTLRYTSRPTVELADRLSELSPWPSAAVHFACSGSEAVEAALKIVRMYHTLQGEPLRTTVIARRHAYHGCTAGAMALDGNYYRTRREHFEPLFPRTWFVDPTAGAEAYEDAIIAARPLTVAAVVVDPMATASGIYPPKDGFWAELREICDRHGVLLVADEVITGFGRTGRWFASAADGVSPDIITVSKGLSSGYQPISAVLTDSRIASVFGPDPLAALPHGHTYAGHPVACAAALANLDIIDKEGLTSRAHRAGSVLRVALDALRAHPYIRDIRGDGLLFGIEVVDPAAPNGSPLAVGTAVVDALRRHGVLTFVLHPGSVLFLCPPLVITDAQITELVNAIEAALADL